MTKYRIRYASQGWFNAWIIEVKILFFWLRAESILTCYSNNFAAEKGLQDFLNYKMKKKQKPKYITYYYDVLDNVISNAGTK